jgi:archaellum component FlaC
MSPREIQRTMDFILRSQADAVIRMDRWEEEWEERFRLWDERIQKQIEAIHAENRETARLVHDLKRETRELKREVRASTRDTRELKKIVREIAIANRRHEKQLLSFGS